MDEGSSSGIVDQHIYLSLEKILEENSRSQLLGCFLILLFVDDQILLEIAAGRLLDDEIPDGINFVGIYNFIFLLSERLLILDLLVCLRSLVWISQFELCFAPFGCVVQQLLSEAEVAALFYC